MDTAVVALIIIALVLFGMLTLAQGYLSAQDKLQGAWRAMEDRDLERSRTSLALVSQSVLGGNVVEIVARNDGKERLADYPQWDVILEYDAATARLARWYPYVTALDSGANEWTVAGIYLDAANAVPEAYEPGILDPGEELVIRIRISPPMVGGTETLVTVATPNGVSVTTAFR